jgi:hypothetical protein
MTSTAPAINPEVAFPTLWQEPMARGFSGGNVLISYFCLTNGICKFVGLFSGLSKARPSTFLLPLKSMSL